MDIVFCLVMGSLCIIWSLTIYFRMLSSFNKYKDYKDKHDWYPWLTINLLQRRYLRSEHAWKKGWKTEMFISLTLGAILYLYAVVMLIL